MGFAVKLVREMSQEMIPASVTLPVGLLKCFNVVHYVRTSWHYCRWWKKHTNPDNIFKIVADRGFGYLLGENKAVQFGAQCIYILSCLNDCANEYQKLFRVYLKLEGLVWGYYPVLNKQFWEKDLSSQSIFHAGSLALSFKKTVVFMKLLAKRIYKLVKTLFRLSMLNMDAVEAFSIDASKRKEAVEEVVSNGAKLIDEFSGNAELLVEKLKENSVFIQKILTEGKTGGTAEQLIGYVEGTLKNTHKGGSAVKSLSAGVLDAVVFVVKEVSFGIFSQLGVGTSMPSWLVPSFCIPSAGHNDERFVPKNWITLKRH